MLFSLRRVATGAGLLMFVILIQPCSYSVGEDAASENFSIVLLPDTQNYSEKYPETYVAQAMWIREQATQDNIKFVIHLGDIVQTSTKQPEIGRAHV